MKNPREIQLLAQIVLIVSSFNRVFKKPQGAARQCCDFHSQVTTLARIVIPSACDDDSTFEPAVQIYLCQITYTERAQQITFLLFVTDEYEYK